jgi:hypothetical protein
VNWNAKNTVTRGDWSVGCTSPRYDAQYNVLPGVVLSIFKIHGRIFQYGEGNGRVFPNTDAAYSWAYEHGFLQPFVHAWCRKHRTLHTFMGKRSGWCSEVRP